MSTLQELGTDESRPIVILSDLHVAHPASLVRKPEQIAELIPRNGVVVFNGDSVEMRSQLDRDLGTANRDALRSLATKRGTQAIFLTGNHDPYVSNIHHLELRKGAILITHGDILFHSVSPWSHESKFIGEEHDRLLAAIPKARHSHFETRLLAAKTASKVLERIYRSKQSFTSVLRNIVMEFIPPWRPLNVLRYWKLAPGAADAIASTYRPNARFVIIGHMHHQGVWSFPERTVINTGCYFPFVKSLMVRIEHTSIQVRSVDRSGGKFSPGKLLNTFPISK